MGEALFDEVELGEKSPHTPVSVDERMYHLELQMDEGSLDERMVSVVVMDEQLQLGECPLHVVVYGWHEWCRGKAVLLSAYPYG